MGGVASGAAAALDATGLRDGVDTVDFLAGAEGTRAFWAILTANLGAAALLCSGMITAGVGSLLGMLVVSVGVGGFAAAGVSRHGWAGVAEAVWVYAPLEFAGLIAAAAAGILPLLAALVPALEEGTRPAQRYVRALARTLPLIAASVALLVMGAIVEVAVISER
jgi:uncharacterized membrane protein SpoIIM required for sporulation